jgi:hypothetical protein
MKGLVEQTKGSEEFVIRGESNAYVQDGNLLVSKRSAKLVLVRRYDNLDLEVKRSRDLKLNYIEIGPFDWSRGPVV